MFSVGRRRGGSCARCVSSPSKAPLDRVSPRVSGLCSAPRHYEQILARDVLMLLPGGLIIDDRQQALDAMSGAPWDAFEMSDERVRQLDDGATVVRTRPVRVEGNSATTHCATAPTSVRTAFGSLRCTNRLPSRSERRSRRRGQDESGDSRVQSELADPARKLALGEAGRDGLPRGGVRAAPRVDDLPALHSLPPEKRVKIISGHVARSPVAASVPL